MPVQKNIDQNETCRWCYHGDSHMAKKVFLVLFAILLCYVIVWVGTIIRNNLRSYYFIGQADRQERTINVQASGKVSVIPNIANVSMGILSEGATVAEAQTKNTETTNKLIESLKSMGIAAEDIQTSNYSVYPQYDYTNKGREFLNFVVSQDVSVKIRDVQKSGQVLALAGELELNRVSGVSFTIDDPEVYKTQAREKALTEAINKAKTIASTLNLKVVDIVSYNEYEQGGIFYARETMGYGMGGGGEAPSIEPGSSEVIMNVNITFGVR